MGSGSRIDPATGRKVRETRAIASRKAGPRPQRSNGRIVPKGKLANARARGTRSTQGRR
jgi:hypothetical protein